jgi:hypothetical protein
MANKYVIVKMANGERYRIPFNVIKDLYKKNYTKKFRETLRDPPDDAIAFGAHNFSNWSDVKEYAVKLPDDVPDHELLWDSSEKTVVKV